MATNIVSKTVTEIATIPITGNVIPQPWWKVIQRGGKPYAEAVIILAEIVYWYRPSEIRNEETGHIIGYRQKFAADKLQRSYSSFAEQFGWSKWQVRTAINHLAKLELITTEFRTIIVRGTAINNVLFVDLNPHRIREITHHVELQRNRVPTQVPQDIYSGAIPPIAHLQTNTTTTRRKSTQTTVGGGLPYSMSRTQAKNDRLTQAAREFAGGDYDRS